LNACYDRAAAAENPSFVRFEVGLIIDLKADAALESDRLPACPPAAALVDMARLAFYLIFPQVNIATWLEKVADPD
jgi:hypothetical protein